VEFVDIAGWSRGEPAGRAGNKIPATIREVDARRAWCVRLLSGDDDVDHVLRRPTLTRAGRPRSSILELRGCRPGAREKRRERLKNTVMRTSIGGAG